MKKTALTLGLFSLVMVATSFANPVVTNSSNTNNIDINFDIDGTGGQSGRDGTRKLDVYNSSLNSAENQFNSLSVASQSSRSTVKVD
jgi:hypothetical protein